MTNQPIPCLICGKAAHGEARPFCSARCRLVDLNRWLNGAYAIPMPDEGTNEIGMEEDGESTPPAP